MSSSHLGQDYIQQILHLCRESRKPPFMNITLMNPEPMNLWTGDRWNSRIQKMKDGEVPSESDQNVGWDSKSHLVHPNVEFVRIQWRKPASASG